MEKDKPFTQLAADLSLRCPGYALLEYDPGTRTARLLDKGYMLTKDANTPHGAILARSYNVLSFAMRDADIIVRERGFARHARETQAIFKMVGVADLAAWFSGRKVFDEIAPLAVKKLMTGSGKASKEEVAAALERYTGKQEYACDDESDAVAVGIAWFILNGYIDGERACSL